MKNVQSQLADCHAKVECEKSNLSRNKERLQQIQDANNATMKTIGDLENQKSTLNASINAVNR